MSCLIIYFTLKLSLVSTASQVAGLAVVSVICFTSSASVAIGTQIPVSPSLVDLSISFSCIYSITNLLHAMLQLFYDWDKQHMDAIRTSLLLVLYYFIGTLIFKNSLSRIVY